MNIAFIAMSGIRACNPELVALGLTLPGFLERGKAIASLPSLGLLTLAGLTRRDFPQHEVHYLEVADLRDLRELPGPFDLVAISSFSAQMNEAYELAGRYRAAGVPVVLGGLHVTSMPGEPAAVDAIAAVGEGEVTWPWILRDLERGTLKKVYDARASGAPSGVRFSEGGGEYDLADSPMPAFELLDIERYNRLTVQTSRGCPWKCSFCAASILLTPKYKQKPIARVLAEIDMIKSLWHHPFIEFADDNAFVNRRYWRELLPELRKRRVKWFAETDISVAEDEELLAMMRDAGCAEVLIGFESPTQDGLAGIEMRGNWKARQWPDYKDAVRRIQAAGVRVNACFVVGLDGHDATIFDSVYHFVEETAPFDVQITLPTPFPNTPFHQQLKREGRLTHDGDWRRCTLFDLNFTPARMSVAELETGFRELMVKLYNHEFTAWRKDRFARQAPRVAWWDDEVRGAPAVN